MSVSGRYKKLEFYSKGWKKNCIMSGKKADLDVLKNKTLPK